MILIDPKILKPLLGRRYKVKGVLIFLVSFTKFTDDALAGF